MMVDISRYALHGTCFFENIVNQRTNRSIRVGLFGNYWFYIELEYEIINNRAVVYPTVYRADEITINYFFKILKPDGSSGITEGNRIVLKDRPYTLCGPKTSVETLEDEGYLENGGLRIEYGFHVESWRDYYGFWNLNLENRFFNGDYCRVKVLYRGETTRFYGHKQIFAFHFNTTNDEIIFRNRYEPFIKCLLQIAHGVCVQVNKLDIFTSKLSNFIAILRCAVHYDLPNVTRIIEMQLMKNEDIFDEEVFEMAVFWKLPHLLAQLLKGSRKDFVISKLRQYGRKPEILGRMSGESMKQLLKFLFDY